MDLRYGSFIAIIHNYNLHPQEAEAIKFGTSLVYV